MSPIRVSGEIANRYAVEQEIGRGATAIVYLARDLQHGRKVALKVLRREVVESVGAARFLREIRLTEQLQHPHIVPVLGSGETDSDLFFALAYMDGGTLRTRLERERQLPIPDVIAIGIAIASALSFAHERNLLHRDVKPENILFTANQACLADFGIARAISTEDNKHSTSTGTIRGTPAYMSPEQASGEQNYDGRSDVYSLACVLYEALAGVQTFVGPTMQSLIAQRMYLEPRPVTAYRSSVPPALAAVLTKALAISPADRYPTAQAFRDALAGAANAPDATAVARTTTRRKVGLSVAAFAILGITAWALRSTGVLSRGADVPLDTTRIAVLPFARDAAVPLSAQAADYVADAVARWKGVSVADQFRVSDAVARQSTKGAIDPSRIALEAGAGRFIRGRLAPIGDSLLVELTLYDNRGRAPLRSASGRLAKADSGIARFFHALVDSVLIGGNVRRPTSERVSTTSSLPATQTFVAAFSALDEWDLSTADSLFGVAIGYDAAFARARVWRAQVEDWRRQSPRTYVANIDAAVADSNNLTERERTLARGLSLLARGEFQAACRVYDAMRLRDDRDFTAWFGLARCQSLDDVVVPNSKSPSSWSYRSSYHRAVQAYARALQLLPSTYRGFERGGFDALQALLYTRSDRVRMGTAAGAGTFVAKPSWSGDTLAFVPYPLAAVSASVSDATPQTKSEALRRQRAVFHEITTSWARAYPESAGAKEALAMSLDMLGDRAAADSLRSARLRTRNDHDRSRLAATEAIVRIKFAIPDDIGELERGVALADSVLAHAADATHDEAVVALPLAAFTGRCSLVNDLAKRAAEATRLLPAHLDAAGKAVTVRASISCASNTVPAELDSLGRVIAATPETAPNADMIRLSVLGQAVSLAFPNNAAVLPQFMKRGATPLFDAELAAVRRDTVHAREAIERVIKAREHSQLHPGDGTPDAVLTETRVMLAINDSARARTWLDAALAQIVEYPPQLFAFNSAAAGSLLQAMVLRADLAHAAGDARGAARWAAVVAVLLRRAEQPLVETRTRMRQFAGRT